ncbi:uncharacterized protein RSE6_08577 [Rhynchosporium secalis]|uniref:Zn(2)-C6 fungal-type domain-containing protein n=1 Tax=Rhynchosporium secalis TaxID=38038 RepID=A0A1E1MFT6_RHYSE|nr:uncharacterized protein RSE6_08577 [Rhynchosporium secalis]
MSYQYPLPSSGMEPSNMIPGFHQPSMDHEQPSSPAQMKMDSPSLKNRGNAAASKSAKIKRSMSTPNVRGQASAEAAALALSAEKRRNKLGYHRTSVACGHCRRRKIRCIAAPGDPHNRCSNCIRLKKECNFFPVDQQPLPEPQRRGSKAQSGTDRASEESSPSTTSGQVLSDIPQTLPYPHLSMPPIQDLGGPQMKRQRTESFSPETKGKDLTSFSLIEFSNSPAVVTTSRNFEYTQPAHHGATNWMAPEASPSTANPKTESSQSYWRVNPQDSPLTPAFSPFTPGLQISTTQNWPTPHTEVSPREDTAWSAPQRSISYSNLEGLHNQHQSTQYAQYPPPPPINEHAYTTKPRVLQSSSMYPPPIQTSASPLASHDPISATSSETHPQPHSAHSLPPVPYSNWQQPYSYQKPAASGPDQYSAWNGSQGQQHLPHLQTEQGHLPPPPGYGYGDPSNGMYYPASHQGR